MKKLLITLLIAATALCFTACGKKSEPAATEPTSQPSTQRHTLPPSEQTPQLEWAPVDCAITLSSPEGVLVDTPDFLTFALDGSTDEDCKLIFAISETAAGTLSARQLAPDELYLTVSGAPLKGKVSFNSDCSEITMQGGYTYSELCRLATAIRGL